MNSLPYINKYVNCVNILPIDVSAVERNVNNTYFLDSEGKDNGYGTSEKTVINGGGKAFIPQQKNWQGPFVNFNYESTIGAAL